MRRELTSFALLLSFHSIPMLAVLWATTEGDRRVIFGCLSAIACAFGLSTEELERGVFCVSFRLCSCCSML